MHHPRTRSRVVCAPSSNLHLPRRQQWFVLRKAVPRLLLQRSFCTIFGTQKIPFLREKKTPPIHHRQVAQGPQHVCPTQMHLLNGILVTVLPRFLDGMEPTQITMTTNGRGLSQPPPFELRGLSANYSTHSPPRLASTIDRLRI